LDECAKVLTQEQKNKLGEKIFEILMIQLFEFGFMQTDPNPANFFYDPERDVLNLIDFGAGNITKKR
jgi:aarF domain-containing kinase